MRLDGVGCLSLLGKRLIEFSGAQLKIRMRSVWRVGFRVSTDGISFTSLSLILSDKTCIG